MTDADSLGIHIEEVVSFMAGKENEELLVRDNAAHI
jgi:hypothetical protein